MRRLIINADDFGLTRGVNRAIAECHGSGVVTSTTLMANAAAFDHAVQLAKTTARLRVGCHVVLVDGAPLTTPTRVSSLLAEGARFRTGIAGFALAALSGNLSDDAITAEAIAQMRKIQSAGIELTHFDTHKHTHMFPQVLRPLLVAARECGARAVRNPFAPSGALALARLLRRPNLWMRSAQMRALRLLARKFRAEVEAAGLHTTDGSWGVVLTGILDQQFFNAIIESIPEGTWEFVCHPGYNDADLDRITTRLRASRQAELDVLTSPESRSLLERRGIQLISYAEL